MTATEREADRGITVGWLYAAPGRDPAIGPTTVRMAGGRITRLDPAPEGAGAGLVALPALVDAHDHGRGNRTLAFGARDDILETWIAALGDEPRVDPYLRAAVAFARLVEGGVAAANHCHNTQDPDRLVEEAAAVARAAEDVGIRVAFAVPIADRNPLVYGDPAPLLDRLSAEDGAAVTARIRAAPPTADLLAAVDAIAAFENPCFQVQYGPVGPQWVREGTLAAIADASLRTGRRVHMHCLETFAQREWADAAYLGGLVSWLDGLGLLSDRLTLAHGVWLRPPEAELLASRGVVVSVNGSSNLRLRSGIAPVATFRAAGLAFGLGLDGMALDDDEDMLRELRVTWLLQRGFAGNRTLEAGDLFAAACIDGRRSVLGADGGGRLGVDTPADLMVLDVGAMGRDVIDPSLDPLDLILTRATRRHLARLVVAGRDVVVAGRAVGVDRAALEAELVAEGRAAFAAKPPGGLSRRLGTAIADYYRCGCHVGAGPDRSLP